MRFLAYIKYDGSNYYGYQKQPSKRTIQDALESVLEIVNKSKVLVSASGRTDAGVHALKQCIHFDLDVNMTPVSVKKAMNSLLPKDIYVSNVFLVSDSFHARFDVLEKTYLYKINLGEYNPCEKDYVLQYCNDLDISKMIEASKYLLGEHNFKAFTKASEEKETFVRTIYDIEIKKENDYLFIKFRGNGFLRYMVRNLVGTLLEVGSTDIDPLYVKEILDSMDRKKAFKTASACGLYLMDVKYDTCNFN